MDNSCLRRENLILNSDQINPSYGLNNKKELAKKNAENRRGVPNGGHSCPSGGITSPNDLKHARLHKKESPRKHYTEKDNTSMKGGVRTRLKKERKYVHPARKFKAQLLKKGGGNVH